MNKAIIYLNCLKLRHFKFMHIKITYHNMINCHCKCKNFTKF